MTSPQPLSNGEGTGRREFELLKSWVIRPMWEILCLGMFNVPPPSPGVEKGGGELKS